MKAERVARQVDVRLNSEPKSYQREIRVGENELSSALALL